MSAVYIGVGILVLLWGAFGWQHRRKNRGKVICVIEANCAGCRRCVKRCSHHVLEMVADETGKHAAVKYPGKCTACGDCLGKCGFNALKLVERTLK